MKWIDIDYASNVAITRIMAKDMLLVGRQKKIGKNLKASQIRESVVTQI